MRTELKKVMVATAEAQAALANPRIIHRRSNSRPSRPRGLILIAVLVIVALTAMVAATLLFRVRAELAASAATSRGDQAAAAALSGIQVAVATLQSNRDNPAAWSDVPASFKNQMVTDDGANKWYFTLYADNLDASSGSSGSSGSSSSSSSDPTSAYRFGVTDESSKINLNTVDPTLLANLPGLTSDQVASFLAYRGPIGASSQPGSTTKPGTDSGATAAVVGTASFADTYSAPTYSTPGYSANSATGAPDASGSGSTNSSASSSDPSAPAGPPHGPLASIDELLQVPNFEAPTLYGSNAPNYNLGPPALSDPNAPASGSNTTPDPNASSSSSSGTGSSSSNSSSASSPDASDAAPSAGIQPLVTIYSYDRDLDSTGQPRINLNSDIAALEKLNLATDTLRFIKISLADGHSFNNPSELFQAQHTVAKKNADYPDVKVGDVIDSGVDATALALVMDKLTARAPGKDTKIPGLINVNTAPASVLSAIPGITPDIARQIVTLRPNVTADDLGNLAWLVKQGALDEASFKLAAPYLTTRGRQFTVRAIGFGWPCGRYRVYETVVDLDGDKPRYLFFREISRLGLPVPLNADELNSQ